MPGRFPKHRAIVGSIVLLIIIMCAGAYLESHVSPAPDSTQRPMLAPLEESSAKYSWSELIEYDDPVEPGTVIPEEALVIWVSRDPNPSSYPGSTAENPNLVWTYHVHLGHADQDMVAGEYISYQTKVLDAWLIQSTDERLVIEFACYLAAEIVNVERYERAFASAVNGQYYYHSIDRGIAPICADVVSIPRG